MLVVLVASVPATSRAAAAPAGHTETAVHGTGAAAHPYRVYLPSSYAADRPAPLVVMAHGCQTTAEQQQRANLLDPVADREGFVVLYPDVSPVEAGAPGPLRNCWPFTSPAQWHRDEGAPNAIAGMTRAAMARWSVDPERVYMAGMSAGAFMTSIMAAAYPDLFAAVALNAGGAYADGLCLGVPVGIPATLSARMARDEMGGRARVVPRLVTGGDRDQGIPPACADKALEQSLRTTNLVLGASQEGPVPLTPASVREVGAQKPGEYPSTVRSYRDPEGCLIGERWLIHGMNHHWPGGSTDPRLEGFTDPKGPSGAEITWAFLKRFTRSGTAFPCAEAPDPPPRAVAPPSSRPAGCPARWIRVHVPAGLRRLRATVGGKRVRIRRTGRSVARVRLPVTTRRGGRRIVVQGRDADGRRAVRGVTATRC